MTTSEADRGVRLWPLWKRKPAISTTDEVGVEEIDLWALKSIPSIVEQKYL